MLWNREFVELALNRRATAYGDKIEPRVVLLFHMNLIGLWTNLKDQSCLRGELASNESSYVALRKWRNGDNCDRAANELIGAPDGLNCRRRPTVGDEESRSARPGEGFIEAPHIPFCTHLATLTLMGCSNGSTALKVRLQKSIFKICIYPIVW
jgi:hypothetical protein